MIIYTLSGASRWLVCLPPCKCYYGGGNSPDRAAGAYHGALDGTRGNDAFLCDADLHERSQQHPFPIRRESGSPKERRGLIIAYAGCPNDDLRSLAIRP